MAAAAKDVDIRAFASAAAWQRWLAKHHATTGGVWLRFFKKQSGTPSVTHAEALPVALCYGWIDGQLKKYDAESWLHKFTPRRAKSIWSTRNCQMAEQLIADGKMKAAGLKAIAAAKQDGRWGRAYASPSKMVVPEDFLALLANHRAAYRFYKTLNKANVYAIGWRLQTAKRPETRTKRMMTILSMLADGKAFHE
jgi:uncharacterized protein YdeI (YjbR/CyaY-like superfamily)